MKLHTSTIIPINGEMMHIGLWLVITHPCCLWLPDAYEKIYQNPNQIKKEQNLSFLNVRLIVSEAKLIWILASSKMMWLKSRRSWAVWRLSWVYFSRLHWGLTAHRLSRNSSLSVDNSKYTGGNPFSLKIFFFFFLSHGDKCNPC